MTRALPVWAFGAVLLFVMLPHGKRTDGDCPSGTIDIGFGCLGGEKPKPTPAPAPCPPPPKPIPLCPREGGGA
jgi:hypothetical protein